MKITKKHFETVKAFWEAGEHEGTECVEIHDHKGRIQILIKNVKDG